MGFLFPKTYEICKLDCHKWHLSHAEVVIELSHLQKISHLSAKNIPYHTAILAREADSLLLTHTLSLNGPCFLGLLGPNWVQTKI